MKGKSISSTKLAEEKVTESPKSVKKSKTTPPNEKNKIEYPIKTLEKKCSRERMNFNKSMLPIYFFETKF